MKPQGLWMLLVAILFAAIAAGAVTCVTSRMEFIPYIALVAMLTGFVVWVMYVVLGERETNRALERIAQRFHGRFEEVRGQRRVPLHVADYPALLRLRTLGTDPPETITVFTAPWPDTEFRCEVFPDNMSGLRQLLRMQDIEIGAREFDRAYTIKGNDEAQVRAAISAEAQLAIIRLREIPDLPIVGPTLHVQWMGGVLAITKQRSRWSYELLEQFVLLSAQLLTASLASRAGDIGFIGAIRRPEEIKSQCQVCGEQLVGDLVSCPSCRTLHHRDCWKYFGGCSTYACGQKEYRTSTDSR